MSAADAPRYWRRHGCGGRLRSIDGSLRPWSGGMRLRAGVRLAECVRCGARWLPRWGRGPNGDGRVCEKDPRWDTIGAEEARGWAIRFLRENPDLGLGGGAGIRGGPAFEWDARWIVVAPRWPAGRSRIGSVLDLEGHCFRRSALAAELNSPQLGLFGGTP